MLVFCGVVGISLVILIIGANIIKNKKVDVTKVRDDILYFLSDRGEVSIIEVIEHVNIMPEDVMKVIRKMCDFDLITEKNGKVKMTKFGEKAYEKILKDY